MVKHAILSTLGGLLFLCATAPAQPPATKTDSESTPFSIVLLQTALPELSLERFADVVSKAWPADSEQRVVIDTADLAIPEKRDPGFSVGVSGDLNIWVTLSPRPFVKAADIEQVSDLRIRKMLNAHRASISIHVVSRKHRKLNDDETLPATLIPLMTELAAELVDTKTLGIIVPSEEILLPRGADLQSLLREKDPITALKNAANVPVVNSADDDPQIKAAVQEARTTWNQFTKAFESRAQNTESFNVKFPFKSKDKTEFMWIEVTSINENMVTGKLGNDPVWAKDLKLGDEVKMKVSELADWMYLKDGEMVGGFSVKVLLEQQEKATPPESCKCK